MSVKFPDIHQEKLTPEFVGVVGTITCIRERTCSANSHKPGIGRRELLAAVTWELLREEESVLIRWRQSYSLSNREGGLKVFASAMHVE
jgi:hypothetical protein